MTPESPYQPSPPGWTASQLQFVENELAKEYPNHSRHAIVAAVGNAKNAVDTSMGTVRLLAKARRHLAPSGSPQGSVGVASGYPLPA